MVISSNTIDFKIKGIKRIMEDDYLIIKLTTYLMELKLRKG